MKQFSLFVRPDGDLRGHCLSIGADGLHWVFSAEFADDLIAYVPHSFAVLAMRTEVFPVDLQPTEFSFANWRAEGYTDLGHLFTEDNIDDSERELCRWIVAVDLHFQGQRNPINSLSRNTKEAVALIAFLMREGPLSLLSHKIRLLEKGILEPSPYAF